MLSVSKRGTQQNGVRAELSVSKHVTRKQCRAVFESPVFVRCSDGGSAHHVGKEYMIPANLNPGSRDKLETLGVAQSTCQQCHLLTLATRALRNERGGLKDQLEDEHG